eukprot:jgi/Pico_ML_1/53377/g3936.t2
MLELPFLKKRSRIVEIVAANDLVFALAHSGVCVVFHRTTNKRVCYLNVHKDESYDPSSTTRAATPSSPCPSMHRRTTPPSSAGACRRFIRRGQPDAGFPLFESESLKWPGFVEFDDVNGKVLTFSALDSIYKVFDLKNYNLLFEIRDSRNKKIDFIEQFNEKLLVKQENENLQILDVLSGKVTEVNRTEFMTPSAFIFCTRTSSS